MAKKTCNGLSTAEYLSYLEQKEKKLRVKKTLCSDSFEERMLSEKMLSVQKLIRQLKKLPDANKAAGIRVAAEVF